MVYYSPKRQTINRDQAIKLGLGYAMAEDGPTFVATQKGPDAAAGVIFTFGQSDSLMNPDAIVWSRIPNTDLWLGYHPGGNRPGPADLARPETIGGHMVKLADGNEWLVPVARAVNGTSPLPRKLAWDGSKWSAGEVQDRYRDLFGEACRIWDLLIHCEEATVTISDEANLAAMALAVNYRLGPAEISALGLFDTKCHLDVILALVDWPVVTELAKKKAAGEVFSPPGGEA